MYPVSAEYLTAIKAGRRNLTNMTVTIGEEVVAARSASLSESVSDEQDRLLPGVAACATITVSVLGAFTTALIGTEMAVRSGLVVDGEVEYVPLGVFVIQDVQHVDDTNVSTIVGYDRMCLLDDIDYEYPGEITEGNTTFVTFGSVLDNIVPFDGSGTIQWASVPDMSILQMAVPTDMLKGYKARELVADIAGAHGKFARMTRDGLLEFAWYRASGYSIGPDTIYIDGLALRSAGDVSSNATIYHRDSGTGDYTNDLITRSFAAQADPVPSVSSPGSVKFRGNPALQAGDYVSVVCENGTVRQMAVSEIQMNFNGGMSSVIESHGVEKQTMSGRDRTWREIQRLKRSYTMEAMEGV